MTALHVDEAVVDLPTDDVVVTSLHRRAWVLDLPVDLLTLEESVDHAERLLATGRPHQHVVVNAAKVVKARTDEVLRESIEQASIVNIDGQAVVWAARFLGVDAPERVAGIDFMDALLARAAERGWSVYFLGATDEVVARTVEVEQERHPGLVVAGWRNGFWNPEDEAAVVAEVAATKPRILLLAMPTPRKERFAAAHLAALGANLVVGVGGSFDVVAGHTSRAPRWMQRAGLEWFHRLLQEPGRMWKRYLVGNTTFLALVLRARVFGDGGRAGRRRRSNVFISWVRYHGRSDGLADALGVPAEVVGTGTIGNKLTTPWRHAVQTARTLRVLRRDRPEALVVMAPPFPLVVLALLYGRLARRPVILDAHTGAVVADDGTVKPWFLRATRHAAATIVTTEALQRKVEAAGGTAIALHDSPFGPAAIEPSSWPPARPQVVMPSSWWRDEPLDVVREAARLVPEVDVVITGRPSGPLAEASCWPDNVRLTGFVDDDEYEALLATSTAVLALTTRDLTMQRAGYEALILGRPAIVSNTPVLREYFTKGAVFSAPTAVALAAAIRDAVARPQQLVAEMAELRAEKQREFSAGIAELRRYLAVSA